MGLEDIVFSFIYLFACLVLLGGDMSRYLVLLSCVGFAVSVLS